jgi:hypothetical protein
MKPGKVSHSKFRRHRTPPMSRRMPTCNSLQYLQPPEIGTVRLSVIHYARKTTMNTGEAAQLTGLYSSDCCDWEQAFEEGGCSCQCPVCAGHCEGELLDPPPLFSWVELEDTEQESF